MLSKNEIEKRAIHCYLVSCQLVWLYSNSNIAPAEYIKYIQASSLKLGADDFIMMQVEEACHLGSIEETIRELIAFYEGMAFALATVLKTELEVIAQEIDIKFLHQLSKEMGMEDSIFPA